MFYGLIKENYVYEDCLLEINFGDTFNTIVTKIKNAILFLINKAEGLLNKGKDNKIKQGLRFLLNKLKSLLTKSDKIKTKEEAKELTQEVNDAKDELKEIEHEFVGTLTWDNLRSWLEENMKEDDDAGLIVYRPNKNVGVKSGKIFKFIKKEDEFLKLFNVDPHIIHLIVYNKTKDEVMAQKDIGFNELELKAQEILKRYAANDGVIIIVK